MRLIQTAITFGSLVLLCFACEKNSPPVIESISIDQEEVLPEELVWAKVIASDDDVINYSWSTSNGTLKSNYTLDSVLWETPSEPGEHLLFLSLSDGENEVRDELSVWVKPVWFFDQFNIPNEWWTKSSNLKAHFKNGCVELKKNAESDEPAFFGTVEGKIDPWPRFRSLKTAFTFETTVLPLDKLGIYIKYEEPSPQTNRWIKYIYLSLYPSHSNDNWFVNAAYKDSEHSELILVSIDQGRIENPYYAEEKKYQLEMILNDNNSIQLTLNGIELNNSVYEAFSTLTAPCKMYFALNNSYTLKLDYLYLFE